MMRFRPFERPPISIYKEATTSGRRQQALDV
jgi:hypothetical protein